MSSLSIDLDNEDTNKIPKAFNCLENLRKLDGFEKVIIADIENHESHV